MENCKIWIISILSCLFLNVMFSCGNDDNSNNSDDISTPTVKAKNLVRINSSELIYNDQGQLVKIKSGNDNSDPYETTITYSTNGIIMSNPYAIYHLGDVRISESISSVITSMDDGSPIIDDRATFEYDKNGYLIKEVKPHDFAEKGVDNMETTVYEWSDGNIQKITRSYYKYKEETTFSYTAYPNTIPDISQGFIFIGSFLGWQGYLGNRCKNLPESETVTSSSNGPKETITYHYSYKFEDGMVTKVIVNWTLDGNPSTMVHELEWY